MSVLLGFRHKNTSTKFKTALENAAIEVYSSSSTVADILFKGSNLNNGVIVTETRLLDGNLELLYNSLSNSFMIVAIAKLGYEEISRFEDILFVPAPVNSSILTGSIKLSLNINNLRYSSNKFLELDEKIIISKAKMLLISRYDYNEELAYRFIQKISMNTRRKIVETCKIILEHY